MDRRPLLAFALVAVGCTRAGPGPSTAVLSTGALSYAGAIAGDVVVTAELRDRFELIAYDRKRRKQRWRRPLGPAQYDIHAVASDGARVWVASADGTVRAFALADGAPKEAWNVGASATALTVAGRYLATGSATGVVCLRRLDDGAMVHCVVAHDGPITDLDASDRELVSASSAGALSVWSVPSMRRLRSMRVSGSANAVALSAEGVVAIATSAAPLRRTPAIAQREEGGFPNLDRESRVLLWSANGTLATRLGHRGPVTDVAWAGNVLLSASWDRTVRRWSGPRSRVVARFSYLVHGLAATTRTWLACAWSRQPSGAATQVFDLPRLSGD